MPNIKQHLPAIIITIISIIFIFHGPIPQLDHYHDFADQRTFFGIPHTCNVFSNLGFLIVSLFGIISFWKISSVSIKTFLISLFLTGLGSSYYHLSPDNNTLLWDRLPIAITCAALLIAVYEQTHAPLSRKNAFITITVGATISIFTVLFWYIPETHSIPGDLRPYLLLQLTPLLLIPLWHYQANTPQKIKFFTGSLLFYIFLPKCLSCTITKFIIY